MSPFKTKYLVDNNTLNQLTTTQRESEFFAWNVHLISEVLHEARDAPYFEDLQPSELRVDLEVLENLVEVMASLPVGETDLVDLYRNQGNADPLLIAHLLAALTKERDCLLPVDWVLVTDDQALKRKAEEFDLSVIRNRKFSGLIDGAGSGGSVL